MQSFRIVKSEFQELELPDRSVMIEGAEWNSQDLLTHYANDLYLRLKALG